MRTLEAVAISKTIIDNVDENRKELSKEMSKNGFVSVDGIIRQYNPVSYDFVDVTNDVLMQHINSCIKNRWSFISDNQIINALKEELPQLTAVEVDNFKAYMEQYQMEINTDILEDGLKEVLQEYEQYNGLEVKIKNGRDVTNQLIIMKQNHIFANLQSRYLFKYKDGKFQIYNLNDLMGLFNTYLANEDVRIKPSDVQRNRKTYLESLTDIQYIMKEYRKNETREDTLKAYAEDYKKVLKLLKEY
jgi:hypothetical protein